MLLDVTSQPHAWRILAAAALFALVFPGLSYVLNRRWCKGALAFVPRDVVLLAALVFLLAILVEATLNPFYTVGFGEKLWIYRLFPLHDGNVSALAAVVWTSYGVHLYFFNQTLDSRLGAGMQRNLIKALIIGVEAPLLWEVLGNGYFLLTVGEFYAYYLPSDVLHFTSLRVVPFYMLSIYVGLHIHGYLHAHTTSYRLAIVLFAAGAVFLGAG